MPGSSTRPIRANQSSVTIERLLDEIRDLLSGAYFDDIVITNNVAGDPTLVVYKYLTVTIYTVTITYDGSGFMTRVQVA